MKRGGPAGIFPFPVSVGKSLCDNCTRFFTHRRIYFLGQTILHKKKEGDS